MRPSQGSTINPRAEALSVFTRDEERSHHLRLFKVSVELVELRQPKLIAAFVGITPEVTKVLHHDKRFVESALCVGVGVGGQGWSAQRGTPRLMVALV